MIVQKMTVRLRGSTDRVHYAPLIVSKDNNDNILLKSTICIWKNF